MAADYSLILAIINASEDPADALAAFVAQEREDAAHKARRRVSVMLGDTVMWSTP